jgi:hypothetical protein
MKKQTNKEKIQENFLDVFSEYSLKELYLIQEVLNKEIRLSETAKSEGYE